MMDNERSTAINPGEAVEEKVSLSDRFGLWLGFHKCSQDEYLEMINGYVGHFGLDVAPDELRARRAGMGDDPRLALGPHRLAVHPGPRRPAGQGTVRTGRVTRVKTSWAIRSPGGRSGSAARRRGSRPRSSAGPRNPRRSRRCRCRAPARRDGRVRSAGRSGRTRPGRGSARRSPPGSGRRAPGRQGHRRVEAGMEVEPRRRRRAPARKAPARQARVEETQIRRARGRRSRGRAAIGVGQAPGAPGGLPTWRRSTIRPSQRDDPAGLRSPVVEGRDDAAGLRDLGLVGPERGVGRADLARGGSASCRRSRRSRPCAHSASNPARIAKVVVDAVDRVDLVGPGGGQHGHQPGHQGGPAGTRGGSGSPWRGRWGRPGGRRAARPRPGRPWRSRRRAGSPSGVSIIAQIRVAVGRAEAAQARAHRHQGVGPRTFGTRIASGPAPARARRGRLRRQGVSSGLIRTTTSRGPKPGPRPRRPQRHGPPPSSPARRHPRGRSSSRRRAACAPSPEARAWEPGMASTLRRGRISLITLLPGRRQCPSGGR